MTHRFDRFGNLYEIRKDGKPVVFAEPCEDPWSGMNDPRYTAVGSFGCHLYRPLRPGESELWQHSRHVETLREAPWGVHMQMDNWVSLAGDNGLSLMDVIREWKIDPPVYQCKGTVEVLPAAAGWFIKEPKVGVGSFVDLADRLTVTDKGGRALKGWIAKGVEWKPGGYDLTALTDPQRRTAQVTAPSRRRFVLRGPNGRVFVTLQDEFGRWRDRADNAKRLVPRGEDYCHCDKLRGSWELIRRPHVASVLDCAWTGGTGFQDCLCGYRALVPGESYRWWLRLRVGK